jgi:WhiB family redox-sensing transcriptional regulator
MALTYANADIFDFIAEIMNAKDEPWRQWAACHGKDPTLFFPPQTATGTRRATKSIRRAKEICATCPVQAECRTSWEAMPYVQSNHGVWFGTTAMERRGLL